MVNQILKHFKKGSNIFNIKQTNILSAAFVLMTAILLSRVLGLVRTRMLTSAFYTQGNEWQLDVYFAAFRIPDMIFQLLVLGALSSAFIPVYSRALEKNSKLAVQIARSVITLSLLTFFIFSGFIFFYAEQICRFIAPDFSPEKITLMASLSRIMMGSQVFFIMSNFYTGILQSHQRFLVPALAPIAYNLGIILGIVFLSDKYGIYGPTYGVALGAFLHFIIQIPLARSIGFTFKPHLDVSSPEVKTIAKLMLPRTFALAIDQLELTMVVFLASSLSSGSLTLFYLAQQLQSLPVGLFGLTIGQAALPMLSREEDNIERFKQLFISSLRHILYIAFPASVLLLVLRLPVVRIAYGAKSFPWEATLETGRVVAAFSLSIVALAAIQLLVRAFYALQDTKTPLVIGMVSMAINISLSVLFVKVFGFGIVGLSFAVSLAGIIQAILLFAVLNRKLNYFSASQYLFPIGKMLLASALTGIALWLPMRLLDTFILDTTQTFELLILTFVASGCGFMVYIIFSKLLQIEELDQLLSTLKRFGSWRKIFDESEETLGTSVTIDTGNISEK